MLIKNDKPLAPAWGKIVGKDGATDTILKMKFNATNHPVKMYNYVYYSSRDLAIRGIDPGSTDQMQVILNKVYQKYHKLRLNFIKNDPATEHEIDELIRGYCSELEADSFVLDYWVTIHYNGAVWDSLDMNLHKSVKFEKTQEV